MCSTHTCFGQYFTSALHNQKCTLYRERENVALALIFGGGGGNLESTAESCSKLLPFGFAAKCSLLLFGHFPVSRANHHGFFCCCCCCITLCPLLLLFFFLLQSSKKVCKGSEREREKCPLPPKRGDRNFGA